MNDNLNPNVEEYRKQALRHGTAKTSRTANRAADKLVEIYSELKEAGKGHELLPLLDDPEAEVRCWAATHALEIDPLRAERVLQELAEGIPGAVRASASLTLQLWKNGELKLP